MDTPVIEPSPIRQAALLGKKGLVVGIANDASIAYGIARCARIAAADLAVTYLNEKAKPHVEPLATQLGAELCLPLDFRVEGQLETVYAAVERQWGRLDFIVHSVAFAPRDDLHGRVVDCSREGFLTAMDVSVHSFVRMARLAEPLMKTGGTMITLSFYGAEKVVSHYNMMGPVKAALESVTRYLAAELGPRDIRVHAISPGPLKTRAASGIADFDEMLDRAAQRAPQRTLVDIDDCGWLATFLCTDFASKMTGGIHYVDGGYNIVD